MKTNPNQSSSNDRDELARMLPELVERDLPSGRQRQLQEFVMSQIHQDLRGADQSTRRAVRRRFVLGTSALAAVAAVAAAALIVDSGADRSPDTSALPGVTGSAQPSMEGLTLVARTFELAATYAESRPFTPPRPDQWIYIQDRILSPGAVATSKGQNPDVTNQSWLSADGRQMADRHSGELEIWDQENDYPALSTLPTDPQALLDRLRDGLTAEVADDGGLAAPVAENSDLDGAVFGKIGSVLRDYLLPPEVTAALLRAAALIPGVTQTPGTIEVDGEQVIAVGRVQDGWRFEQLLLDPDTHNFVGHHSVAEKDFTIEGRPADPDGDQRDKAAPASVTVKKGEVQFTITRLAAKIVDAAGETS